MNKRIIALVFISSVLCLASCSNMYTTVSTDINLPETQAMSMDPGMDDFPGGPMEAGEMGMMEGDMPGFDMEMDEGDNVSGIHILTSSGESIYEAPYLGISEGAVEEGVLYTVKLDIGENQYVYTDVDLTEYTLLETEETDTGVILIVGGTSYTPGGDVN